ncbi:hypothetical protein FEM48_Zijuj11G0140300 [Ziziphus jujuba var. spinosa]|uniref:Disease resistance RPP13-like protein 1 n=1 Tax=Ziziphus jujuba var. spinosa TaxID=714518 RepID=A0A978UJC9_ZIZJJ|nr:hypothetical protein FEM48_Zijuj11G0140300 [Ziziphus jujuba var. spinosa]
MVAVAEIFLGALLQMLFEKLMSREVLDFARGEGVHKKLEKWSSTLRMIQAVLSDAEAKQLTSEAVKLWLADLRDLAYDVEDVLDKFYTKQIQNLLQGNSWKFTHIFMRKINSEINEITKRFDDISSREIKLGLNKIERSVPEWKRLPSSSLPDSPVVVGRDEDKKKIVELLLSDNQNKENFDVVGLVGMPGVGKTTLARLAFKDDAMKYFDIKVWVSVSDDFDYVRLTKAILNSIDSESKSFDEFSQIQNHLSKDLAGKKFLIVMDDVWNKKIFKKVRHSAYISADLEGIHRLEDMENWKDWFPDETNDGIDRFLQLKKLVVKRCPMLKGKLPKNLPSLKDLEVWGCEQLTVSIPSNQMLCSLIIRYCAEVVCENHAHLKSLKSINVSGIRKFRELYLNGKATDMVSFPPEDEKEKQHEKDGRKGMMMMMMMLPKTLITLSISGFENLEKLSAGLQCLTSLQHLCISDCKKLKSLPKGGLPLSLLKLLIQDCQLLQKKCRRDTGPFWPHIAHIPRVEFLQPYSPSNLRLFSGELEGVMMMLPKSLTDQRILRFQNLNKLSKRLQFFASLEYLISPKDCVKFASLTEGGLPLSLLKLETSYYLLIPYVTGISFHDRPLDYVGRFRDTYVKGVENCKIKKCGIWLIYDGDTDQEVDGEQEKPKASTTRRRFGESFEASGIGITYVVGSDDEDEYQHKRRVLGFEETVKAVEAGDPDGHGGTAGPDAT